LLVSRSSRRPIAWQLGCTKSRFASSLIASIAQHRSADDGRQKLARSKSRRFASCANFMKRPAESRSDGVLRQSGRGQSQ
jgi:hypothetical protein